MVDCFEARWWHDSGCFAEIFDTKEEARSKCFRERDMGAYKTEIKRVVII